MSTYGHPDVTSNALRGGSVVILSFSPDSQASQTYAPKARGAGLINPASAFPAVLKRSSSPTIPATLALSKASELWHQRSRTGPEPDELQPPSQHLLCSSTVCTFGPFRVRRRHGHNFRYAEPRVLRKHEYNPGRAERHVEVDVHQCYIRHDNGLSWIKLTHAANQWAALWSCH